MAAKIILSGPQVQSGSSAPVAIPNTSTNTLALQVECKGIGPMSINGFVSSGAIIDMTIATAASPPSSIPGFSSAGTSVNRLNGVAGDFGTATEFLNSATTTPHLTTAGNGFCLEFELKGRVARVDLYVKSSAGAVMNFDSSGAGLAL